MEGVATKISGSRSPNETDKLVGKNIRRLRIERGMTLQGLAETISVSHQQLQKYETGSNRLSAGMIPIVSDALGVGLGELFETGERSGATRTNKVERLRDECAVWLRQTKSEDTLRMMSRVLKALSS